MYQSNKFIYLTLTVEVQNWEVAIIIKSIIGFRYNDIYWLPYHKVFFDKLFKRIQPDMWKDIQDVLVHPNYDRFTHFAQMYNTKMNYSNRIFILTSGKTRYWIDNKFGCVIKLIFSVISRFRINQKIIV